MILSLVVKLDSTNVEPPQAMMKVVESPNSKRSCISTQQLARPRPKSSQVDIPSRQE